VIPELLLLLLFLNILCRFRFVVAENIFGSHYEIHDQEAFTSTVAVAPAVMVIVIG
jgi:hypothetical protein